MYTVMYPLKPVNIQEIASSNLAGAYFDLNLQDCEYYKIGLVRDLNPGPLAP